MDKVSISSFGCEGSSATDLLIFFNQLFRFECLIFPWGNPNQHWNSQAMVSIDSRPGPCSSPPVQAIIYTTLEKPRADPPSSVEIGGVRFVTVWTDQKTSWHPLSEVLFLFHYTLCAQSQSSRCAQLVTHFFVHNLCSTSVDIEQHIVYNDNQWALKWARITWMCMRFERGLWRFFCFDTTNYEGPGGTAWMILAWSKNRINLTTIFPSPLPPKSQRFCRSWMSLECAQTLPEGMHL